MRPNLRGITPGTLLDAAHTGALQDSVFLRSVTPTDLATLMTGGRWVRLQRGQRLALRGSRPGLCWLLLAGHVKEHRPQDDGSESLSGFRGPGELVAEIAAIIGAPSEHDVTALGSGEALVFPADHVAATVAATPGLQAAMLQAVTHRAAHAEDALARNTVCDTAERVALAVLELVDRWGRQCADGIEVALPLTQSELAEWIGTSRETAAKVLHRLRSAGLVETSRRRLVVQDLDGLRRAAGMFLPDAHAIA